MHETNDPKIERFVLRLNLSLFKAISQQAEHSHRSINGEICAALDSWLFEFDQLMLVRNRIAQATGKHAALEIIAAAPNFPTSPNKADYKTMVRLKETQLSALKARIERHKAQVGKFTSQNNYVQMVLIWWVTFSFEVREFSKSLTTHALLGTGAHRTLQPQTPDHALALLRTA